MPMECMVNTFKGNRCCEIELEGSYFHASFQYSVNIWSTFGSFMNFSYRDTQDDQIAPPRPYSALVFPFSGFPESPLKIIHRRPACRQAGSLRTRRKNGRKTGN